MTFFMDICAQISHAVANEDLRPVIPRSCPPKAKEIIQRVNTSSCPLNTSLSGDCGSVGVEITANDLHSVPS